MQHSDSHRQPAPSGNSAPRSLAAWFTEQHEALRRIATRQLHRRRMTHRLEADELVSEIYLVLTGKPQLIISDNRHFRALSAQLMAWFITDQQRRHGTLKQGGDRAHVAMIDWEPPAPQPCHMIQAVKDGLSKCCTQRAEEHPVLVLRGQAGFTIVETADLLEIPVIRVKRLWQRGCRRLKAELQPYHTKPSRSRSSEPVCLG